LFVNHFYSPKPFSADYFLYSYIKSGADSICT
jgi:hypothetical protein